MEARGHGEQSGGRLAAATAKYALAIGSACLALALKLILGDYLSPPYILFFGAVLLSALVGGLGPGVIATLVSAGLAYVFLFEPRLTLRMDDPREIIGLGFFIVIGVLISVVAGRRRQTEARLRASEACLAEVARQFPGGLLAVLDADLRHVMVDGEGLAQIGEVPSDRLGRSIAEVFDPATLAVIEPMHRAALGGRASERDVLWQGRVFRVKTRPIEPDEHGRPRCLVVSQDVTEQTRAEEALRESKERLAFAVRATGAGVWDWDVRNNRMTWDDRMFELYGVNRETAPSTVAVWESGLHPADRERAISESAESLAGRRPFDTEFRVKRPDGSVVFIKADGLVLRDPDGTPLRMIGLNRDVTAQKSAERALRESNEVLGRFVKDSPVYAFIKEVRPGRSVVLAASENYREMLGIPGSRMVGKPMEELFPPELAAKITSDDWSVVSSGKSVTLDEELNGRNYTTIKFPIPLESRALLAGYTLDVTDRKRAEEESRESQRSLLLSQEIARIGSYVFDVSRGTWSSSASLDLIFGIDATHPRTAEAWLQLVHPEDREAMGLYLADLLARGFRFDREYRIVNQKSGEATWVHGLGELQRIPGGGPARLVGTIQDITARKTAEVERQVLEAKLALASRLAAMGTLVAGVAHEINNPLTASLGNGGIALEEALEARSRLARGAQQDAVAQRRYLDVIIEALEEATEGGQRVARIVKDLATFANPDPKRTRLHLADFVATAIRWMPKALGQGVDIRVEDRGAPPVLASAGQIEQVVVNLLTNAAKATPPGKRGDIVVEIGPAGPGRARIDVIDDGTGIAPEIRDRIFEPFFTTRRVGVGKGAGLGLAICHAIITDHGGTLSVESEVGKGSTFRVELPAAPLQE